jgi:hypothetical protein
MQLPEFFSDWPHGDANHLSITEFVEKSALLSQRIRLLNLAGEFANAKHLPG